MPSFARRKAAATIAASAPAAAGDASAPRHRGHGVACARARARVAVATSAASASTSDRPRDCGASAGAMGRAAPPAMRARGRQRLARRRMHPHAAREQLREAPTRAATGRRAPRPSDARRRKRSGLRARRRFERAPREGLHAARAVHGFPQASVQCRSLVVRTASRGCRAGATIARTSSTVSAARSDASKRARCRSCIARASGAGRRDRRRTWRRAPRTRAVVAGRSRSRTKSVPPAPHQAPHLGEHVAGSGMWCTMLFDITSVERPIRPAASPSRPSGPRGCGPTSPARATLRSASASMWLARSIASTSTRAIALAKLDGDERRPGSDVEHARRPNARREQVVAEARVDLAVVHRVVVASLLLGVHDLRLEGPRQRHGAVLTLQERLPQGAPPLISSRDDDAQPPLAPRHGGPPRSRRMGSRRRGRRWPMARGEGQRRIGRQSAGRREVQGSLQGRQHEVRRARLRRRHRRLPEGHRARPEQRASATTSWARRSSPRAISSRPRRRGTARRSATEKDPALRARVLFVLADLKERQQKWDDARAAWQVYLDWASKYPERRRLPGQRPVAPAGDRHDEEAGHRLRGRPPAHRRHEGGRRLHRSVEAAAYPRQPRSSPGRYLPTSARRGPTRASAVADELLPRGVLVARLDAAGGQVDRRGRSRSRAR